ncbi:MAG: universal stress protein, partial [Rivularia sp. (in: cyanobacteria)]
SEKTRSKDSLFNLLVDRVIQEAPCATMVVKSHLSEAEAESSRTTQQQLKNILVPTVGTEYSKNAVEVASTIAAQTGAIITIVNVINLPPIEYILYERRTLNPMKDIASDLLEQQAVIGRSFGADVKTRILKGTSAEMEILTYAENENFDLIILGSNIRMVTGRVFFGHRVDAILKKAHCPVAVITAP